jgi:hypothetical protein
MREMRIFRALAMIAVVFGLVACAEQTPLSNQIPADLGEFKLNVNYAFAEKAGTVPPTRYATAQEWETAVQGAVAQRLGRYSGSQPYDIGVSVEGYLLAPKGVPVLYNPRSTLIVNVNVYDPVTKKWLAKGHQIQSLENTESDTVFWGSGRTRSKQEQMNGLAYNMARQLEKWLIEQQEAQGWFAPLATPKEPQ